MVKKIFLSSMLILPLFSCNTDDDYEFNDIQGEYAVMQQSTNASKTRARAAAYSTSGWETVEYTGTPTFQTYNNQKIILNGAAINGVTGTYICQVVKVSCTINVSNPDDEIVRGVSNDTRCGFVPGTASTSSPVRGTQAIQNPSNLNQYTVTSVCYKIITNMAGMAYPSNYWVPCSPDDVTLYYLYRSF